MNWAGPSYIADPAALQGGVVELRTAGRADQEMITVRRPHLLERSLMETPSVGRASNLHMYGQGLE